MVDLKEPLNVWMLPLLAAHHPERIHLAHQPKGPKPLKGSYIGSLQTGHELHALQRHHLRHVAHALLGHHERLFLPRRAAGGHRPSVQPVDRAAGRAPRAAEGPAIDAVQLTLLKQTQAIRMSCDKIHI